MNRTRSGKLWALGAGIAVLAAITLWVWNDGVLSAWLSQEMIEAWVTKAGLWGPVVIVGLMSFAVVASPVPSAPIAVAAGAAYGHTIGTALVVFGAELGAVTAFLMARWLGHDAVRNWFGAKLNTGLLGSQNVLMLTVFGSRLLPFISFDLISYAAGLTQLHFWRFGLATFAGILPASFVLAHLGSEMLSSDTLSASMAVFALGVIAAAPVLWLAWNRAKELENPLDGNAVKLSASALCK